MGDPGRDSLPAVLRLENVAHDHQLNNVLQSLELADYVGTVSPDA